MNSIAFDILIKFLESYRSQIPSGGRAGEREREREREEGRVGEREKE